jgi:hypothetical protein
MVNGTGDSESPMKVVKKEENTTPSPPFAKGTSEMVERKISVPAHDQEDQEGTTHPAVEKVPAYEDIQHLPVQ